jgi:hypothetical protein
MAAGSQALFDSLDSYSAVEGLVTIGETEGLFLECKSPTTPLLSKELRIKLACAVSAFKNTEGGCLIWGASTTKHAHSGLDVISQIEPVGQVQQLAKQIETTIPRLTTPSATNCTNHVLFKNPGDTKGVIVTHVPKSDGDPTQSVLDNLFYFRSGDESIIAPFEIIRRHFAAIQSPDLVPIFNPGLVKLQPNGAWYIPIILENRSTAIAEHVKVCVTIENPTACERIDPKELRDTSAANPGKRLFMTDFKGVIHRGINQIVGSLNVRRAARKRTHRQRARLKLDLKIEVYANKMRGQHLTASLILAKKGFTTKGVRLKNAY